MRLGAPKPGELSGFRDRPRAMGTAADAEWLRWASRQFGNGGGKEKEIGLEEFKSALRVREVRDSWEKRDPGEKKGIPWEKRDSLGKKEGSMGRGEDSMGRKEWDPWEGSEGSIGRGERSVGIP